MGIGANRCESVVRVVRKTVIRFSFENSVSQIQLEMATSVYLKEQYPVTAHAPNFDFWTGCREIKRCEESMRTLKDPFASRLTGFKTTLKLLRITDQ